MKDLMGTEHLMYKHCYIVQQVKVMGLVESNSAAVE